MGNSESSSQQDSDIKSLFSSSKITDPLNFNADFLIKLTNPSKLPKKKRKANSRDFQSHIFAFISKDGEFTALSNLLPDILYHVIIGETKITSACNFYPSNTLIASAINRNSIIVVTFNFLDEDFNSDSYLYSQFEFLEIKGIEKPQLVEKVDEESFIIANSLSSIYLLNMKKYFANRSNKDINPYEKLIDSPQQSEPKCLAYFNGFFALSTCTGLLIGKIRLSESIKASYKQKSKENEAEVQLIPCSLFNPDFANANNLTFIKINDTSVLLFFVTSDKHSVKYIRINDLTNMKDEKDPQKIMVSLHISIDDPIEIYSLNPSYITSNKDEIFITDLIHPETKIDSENDDNSNKTIIFSCGREIFSFTPSLSLFKSSTSTSSSNLKSNPILLTEKIQINYNIQVKIRNSNLNEQSDEIKTYTCFNSIVKLICTNDPRVFAALFLDGTVVICRHPPYQIQGSSRENISSSIKTAILFNYHRCKPILSCNADNYSFLTFDENHVAILWESFPDWWTAPYYFKMFADNNDDEEDKNEYDNAEEEKNDDIDEDHF